LQRLVGLVYNEQIQARKLKVHQSGPHVAERHYVILAQAINARKECTAIIRTSHPFPNFLTLRRINLSIIATMLLLPALLSLATLPSLITAAFPNAPFVTSKQWVHDSTGANFTYAGVNWPGAADVMIPEGLQYQSIANIVTKIKSLKMNVVRLTFAIEMIDDIKDNGDDVTVQKAFTKALGAANGEKVWQRVLKNNPAFSTSTTRVQVSDLKK
jgi:hypothetical protein